MTDERAYLARSWSDWRRRRPRAEKSSTASRPDRETSLVSAVRDEIILIGLLIAFAGLSFIDGYYNFFGIKYQLLPFQYSFILYQGILSVVQQPWLFALYVLTTALVHVVPIVIKQAIIRVNTHTVLVVPLVPVLLLATYVLAHGAGQARANLDSQPDTTTLPLVVKLVVNDAVSFNRGDNLRLLLVTSDHIVAFEPQSVGALPKVKRFQTGDIREFETTR